MKPNQNVVTAPASDFLPEGYETPKATGGYLKLANGENKIRILSKPVIGWEYWNHQDKPVRIEGLAQPKVDRDLIRKDKFGNQSLKHFWAFICWNYNDEAIQIYQVQQATIQSGIEALVKDADWGSVYDYDIKVNKKGQDKETEYSVTPVPKKKLSSEIISAFNDKQIDLHALLDGKDPFNDIINVTPMELSL